MSSKLKYCEVTLVLVIRFQDFKTAEVHKHLHQGLKMGIYKNITKIMVKKDRHC